MFFLILLYFITVTKPFNSARQLTLSLNTTLYSTNYINSTKYRVCKCMTNTKDGLYRVDAANRIEYWNIDDGNYTKKQRSFSKTIQRCDTDQNNTYFLVVAIQSSTRIIDILNSTSFVNFYGFLIDNDAIDAKLEEDNVLVMRTAGSSQQYHHIAFTPPNTYVVVNSQTKMSGIGRKMEATSDKRVYFVWGYDSDLHIYENVNNSLTLQQTITMNGTGYLYNVHFNSDETLAAVESDQQSNILVIDFSNLTNITVLHSIFPTQDIKGLSFMDTYNDILCIFGIYNTMFYSLVNKVYVNSMAVVADSQYIKTFYNQNLAQVWLCKKEGLMKYQTSVIGCMDSEATLRCHGDYCSCCTSNCLNCSIAGFCSICISGFIVDSSNGTCIISPQSITEVEQTIAYLAEPIRDSISTFLVNVMIILSLTPFVFLFIRTISFFSIASLYIFLEVKIPEYLYLVISGIYKSMNEELVSYFNIKFKAKPFSHELIDNQKVKEYLVTSDIFVMNYENIILFTFVTCNIFLLNWIASKIKTDNPLYKLCSMSKFDVLSGQFISIMIGLILPFKYIMTYTYRNFPTKINMIISYSTSFAALIFPFIYLMGLIDNHQKKQKKRRKKILQIRTKKNLKTNFKKTKMITIDILDNFYVSMMNVTFPLFVLLSNMIYFFVINFFILLVGIVKSFYAKKRRKNKIILSLYPMIYHISFLGLWLFQEKSLRAVFGMTALASLLIGAIHEILYIVLAALIQIGKKIRQSVRQWLNKNKVGIQQENEPETEVEAGKKAKDKNKAEIEAKAKDKNKDEAEVKVKVKVKDRNKSKDKNKDEAEVKIKVKDRNKSKSKNKAEDEIKVKDRNKSKSKNKADAEVKVKDNLKEKNNKTTTILRQCVTVTDLRKGKQVEIKGKVTFHQKNKPSNDTLLKITNAKKSSDSIISFFLLGE